MTLSLISRDHESVLERLALSKPVFWYKRFGEPVVWYNERSSDGSPTSKQVFVLLRKGRLFSIYIQSNSDSSHSGDIDTTCSNGSEKGVLHGRLCLFGKQMDNVSLARVSL